MESKTERRIELEEPAELARAYIARTTEPIFKVKKEERTEKENQTLTEATALAKLMLAGNNLLIEILAPLEQGIRNDEGIRPSQQ
jgi:hypothetical protein